MKQGGKKRNGLKKHRILALICLSLFAVSLFSVLIGVFVNANFDRFLGDTVDPDNLTVRSPRFYAYAFEDRVNRVGEAIDVTSSVYAQRETVYVPYNMIPDAMVKAFVAIEDQHFFAHHGVNWFRTLAASANYLFGFSDTFGASTITQQLIKNLTGESDVSIRRKLQEIFYARDLERKLDKTEIMELYLNVIHFSDHCDGIGAAAKHYFSKTPLELSVAECATIAAITNHPSYYNPIRHPEHNLERRNLILHEMYQCGFLSADEYMEEINTPLLLNVDDESNQEGINSWYTDMVIDDVIQDLMHVYGMTRHAATRMLYTGGLRIDMALDREIQEIVEEYYRTAISLPQNESGERAQSALIVLDRSTGDILGVAGAVGEKNGNHLQNFATQTHRSPGSTVKPLSVYAPALEEGIISWGSVYDDVPTDFYYEGHSVWPQNATRIYRGLTDISYAVAHSTNTVAVRVLRELGEDTSLRYVRNKFHLTDFLDSDKNVAPLALGQMHYGVTLRDLTTAYTAFADGGIYHPYRSYYRVLDSEGEVLLSNETRGETVISSETAAIMTKLLQGVISNGTSGRVTLDALTECAGKTGTTSNDCDRWFIGYTPDLICGVWCGYEYPEPLVGKNICTGIWNGVMKRIVSEVGGAKCFEIPSTLIRVDYCKDSGGVPCKVCTMDPRGNRIGSGWYVVGSEPKEFCRCHVLCPYDLENGGVIHGSEEDSELTMVGLIRVRRNFPMQIYVTDAQYVYHGSPKDYPVNERADRAYFAQAEEGFCGISNVEKQYNRSAIIPKNKEDTLCKENRMHGEIQRKEGEVGAAPVPE